MPISARWISAPNTFSPSPTRAAGQASRAFGLGPYPTAESRNDGRRSTVPHYRQQGLGRRRLRDVRAPACPERESFVPRYFFDFHDNGRLTPDDEGTECASMATVCQEASLTPAEIAKDILPRSGPHRLSIEVRDDANRPCLRASLTFDVSRL